jgi:hypothetical protein
MTSFRRPGTDNPRERRGGRRDKSRSWAAAIEMVRAPWRANWTASPSAEAPRPKDRDAGILRRRNERLRRNLISTSEAATADSSTHERDVREWKAVWAEAEATTKTIGLP